MAFLGKSAFKILTRSQFTIFTSPNRFYGGLIKTIGEVGTEPGQFDGPAGLAISSKTGIIYVTDQFNNQIQALDSKE
ncbi:MAG: hypothetical protein HC890_20455 [Chloroflexaceae bacterium]|nr:hypothetical protein [Chloroflexaceae bacterium]